MFPIALDLTRVPILLVGRGELLEKRRRQLVEYGATKITCHSCQWHEIPQQVRDDSKIIMVAGLPRDQAEAIVQEAHAAGKLVNVEDINDLCDFYFTANVKRGDLVIAVSTSGASPTLARKIRDVIAGMFGEEWAPRLKEISQLRQVWKAQGKGMKEVVEQSERHIQEKKWLAS